MEGRRGRDAQVRGIGEAEGVEGRRAGGVDVRLPVVGGIVGVQSAGVGDAGAGDPLRFPGNVHAGRNTQARGDHVPDHARPVGGNPLRAVAAVVQPVDGAAVRTDHQVGDRPTGGGGQGLEGTGRAVDRHPAHRLVVLVQPVDEVVVRVQRQGDGIVHGRVARVAGQRGHGVAAEGLNPLDGAGGAVPVQHVNVAAVAAHLKVLGIVEARADQGGDGVGAEGGHLPDGVVAAVGPVEIAAVQRDGGDVGHPVRRVGDGGHGVGPEGLGPLDGVVAVVGPVDVGIVHRDAVGRADAGAHQGFHAARAVGGLAANLVVAVVGPVDVVAARIQGEVVGGGQLRVAHHRLGNSRAVQAGALDLGIGCVQPVVPVHRAGLGGLAGRPGLGVGSPDLEADDQHHRRRDGQRESAEGVECEAAEHGGPVSQFRRRRRKARL